MDSLSEPQRKKHCKLSKPGDSKALPLFPLNDSKQYHKFAAVFNGFSVVIAACDGEKIVKNGYFGKGNFSRTLPQFDGKGKTKIVRKRVAERRKSWGNKLTDKKTNRKIIVVPDSNSSSSSDDDYFINLQPQYQIDCSGIQENIQLMLEEAFFLQHDLNSLEIHHNNKQLNSEESWDLFKETDKYFAINYIAYYYFRMKNWVVKTGIKFGGDFLLYKQGPPFYHASYVVIIDVVNGNFKTIQHFKRRSMDFIDLMGLNRLCETTGKELLICQILWPFSEDTAISFNDLMKFSVNEVLMTRWLPNQERLKD